MRILLIGSGGREHAIAVFLKKNPEVEELYVLPGNAGIAEIAKTADIKAVDIDSITAFAMEKDVDFVFVAPDDPLVLGAVDALSEKGFPCFGPNKAAAVIEGSKVFAKDLMKRYSIPTAEFEVFDDYGSAAEYIASLEKYPVVIKADGLALGKGVVIANEKDEAMGAIDRMMNERAFGASGERVVIERFLSGPEVSALCFTDGKVIKPLASSMDHKRIFDGNKGPNTGGMGAVAPNRHYTAETEERCMREIFIPTMNAMNSEGRTFKGCLYFGLMLTEEGPKVIEYNCRFGDPEAQAVLPLLESDLLTVIQAVSEGRLSETEVKKKDAFACCVVVASGGYPGKYEVGKPIEFNDAERLPDTYIFHAGTKRDENGRIMTSGGRVIGVTAVGTTREESIEKAYRAAEKISFKNAYYRKDIGRY